MELGDASDHGSCYDFQMSKEDDGKSAASVLQQGGSRGLPPPTPFLSCILDHCFHSFSDYHMSPQTHSFTASLCQPQSQSISKRVPSVLHSDLTLFMLWLIFQVNSNLWHLGNDSPLSSRVTILPPTSHVALNLKCS